jgi:hypothetical protein
MKKAIVLLALLALAGFSQITPPGGGGGSGSGTVTSVTVAGTAHQITVSGTCTSTTSVSCTMSLPSDLILPLATAFSASTTAGASMVIPSGVAPTGAALTSGAFWNLSGALQFYNGATKTIAYTDSAMTGTWQTHAPADFALAGAATTVNGQSCALGLTCTVTAVPSAGTVLVAQKFFGTAAPGSVATNLPGDLYTDTTNHHEYVCNAPSGTAAPACTAVAAAGWLQVDGGSAGSSTAAYPVRGLTQAGVNAWNWNYFSTTNGVPNNGTYLATNATHNQSIVEVTANTTLLDSNAVLSSGTYTSGGSASGSGTCTVTMANPSGTAATATVPVSGGVISGGAILTVTGAGTYFAAAPTSATLSNGSGGTCSGTAVVSTVLSMTPVGPHTITPIFATNPTVTFTATVRAASSAVDNGSLGLAYACVPAATAVDNPTPVALTPITLTTPATTSSVFQSAQAITCTASAASPAELWVWWTPTAMAGEALDLLQLLLQY